MRATFNRLLLTIAVMAVAAPPALADTVTAVKKINLNQTDTQSPYFTHDITGAPRYSPADLGDAIFTPVGTVHPGTITSLTTIGAFSIDTRSTLRTVLT